MIEKPVQTKPSRPSYAGYILALTLGSVILSPIFFAFLFWAFGGGTLGDGLGWGVFGAALLFIPVILYAWILGWFIKYMNIRRTPAGQVESVAICIVSIMPFAMIFGEAIVIVLGIAALTSATLSFLLPKPDPEE